MIKENVNSKRIQVINYHTFDIHDNVASLNEALVDREPTEALSAIEAIRSQLNILRKEIVDGDIV